MSEAKTLEKRLAEFGLKLVEEAIGSGGSAIVHKAIVEGWSGRFPEQGTLVAVKEYKPELLLRDGQLRRVQQEADLGARFDSAHVVKTFGLFPNKQSPEFLVMEWVAGKTLDAWSAELDEVTWDRLKPVALGLVEGLQLLHQASVHHRDLKPENVMVRVGTPDVAVITDVGVAELTVEPAETMHTTVGEFLGSQRYASPQYLMGETFTDQDDVYGLGTVLFELFTGRKMFDGQERKPILPVVVINEGQRVDSLRDAVPAPLKILLQGTINRDRARRPTLDELKEAIDDPAGSSYISAELERQTAEERGFPVLRILDDGMSFFADLAGGSYNPGREFVVVRRGESLDVPSLSRKISPERWVGTATLKHIFQGVGHFVLHGKRWHENKNSLQSMFGGLGSGGRWVEHEQLATSVKAGDWVLKERP